MIYREPTRPRLPSVFRCTCIGAGGILSRRGGGWLGTEVRQPNCVGAALIWMSVGVWRWLPTQRRSSGALAGARGNGDVFDVANEVGAQPFGLVHPVDVGHALDGLLEDQPQLYVGQVGAQAIVGSAAAESDLLVGGIEMADSRGQLATAPMTACRSPSSGFEGDPLGCAYRGIERCQRLSQGSDLMLHGCAPAQGTG